MKRKAVIEVRKVRGPVCVVSPVFFSADGKTLASMISGQILLSDAAKGTELLKVKEENLETFTIAPDGKTLASAGRGEIRIRETATGAELFRLPGPPEKALRLCYARDGRRLACIGGDLIVRIWDVVARRELAKFALPGQLPLSLAFNPDGNRLAVGTHGSILVWTVPVR